MRQFATVSISPWRLENPYNGTVNTGQNYYTAASSAKQLDYRRIVALPAPQFYHPGVQQVADDSEDGTSRCHASLLTVI
jgi:hypothetical protein